MGHLTRTNLILYKGTKLRSICDCNVKLSKLEIELSSASNDTVDNVCKREQISKLLYKVAKLRQEVQRLQERLLLVQRKIENHESGKAGNRNTNGQEVNTVGTSSAMAVSNKRDRLL